MTRLLVTYLLLLALLGCEFAFSFLPISRELRPLLLIPALVMVALVGVQFMQVRSGPTIVRLFTAAALLWLILLLGLGSLDPLTRMQYPVTSPAVSIRDPH
jgi:cytochrome c oxidase subunit IV